LGAVWWVEKLAQAWRAGKPAEADCRIVHEMSAIAGDVTDEWELRGFAIVSHTTSITCIYSTGKKGYSSCNLRDPGTGSKYYGFPRRHHSPILRPGGYMCSH
jgi:hypothetical protein